MIYYRILNFDFVLFLPSRLYIFLCISGMAERLWKPAKQKQVQSASKKLLSKEPMFLAMECLQV